MRLADWQRRYNEAVAAMRDWPFAWGEHDCVTFPVRVADAITGGDYLSRARARYAWDSALSAARIVEAAGGLEALVSEFFGAPVNWGRCMTGDPILATNRDGGQILAVMDAHYLLAPGAAHLGGLPLDAAIKGWRL